MTAKCVIISATVLAVTLIIYLSQAFGKYTLPEILFTVIALVGMAIIFVTDHKKNIIPNIVLKIMFLGWILIMGIYLVFNINAGIAILAMCIMGMIASGSTFLLCYIISRKMIGAGDVKLAIILGLLLTGDRVFAVLIYGLLIMLAYSFIQIARKKMTWKSRVPMGPFLYLGTAIITILSVTI